MENRREEWKQMENLIFSLNATIPVFLIMILGTFLSKVGWIDDVFASKMNRFVFTVPLPVLLFGDLASIDFDQVWNLKFVIFCSLYRRECRVCGRTALSGGNLYSRLIEAARRSWGLRLSRISMVRRVWRPL